MGSVSPFWPWQAAQFSAKICAPRPAASLSSAAPESELGVHVFVSTAGSWRNEIERAAWSNGTKRKTIGTIARGRRSPGGRNSLSILVKAVEKSIPVTAAPAAHTSAPRRSESWSPRSCSTVSDGAKGFCEVGALAVRM